jgi:hypothetical protein
MSSAKSLNFWFSRLRNFRFRGFQCYQSLAADFVSRSSLSRRFPVVGRRSRSFLYLTVHVIFSFWKTKFRSCHRAASNICRGDPQKLRVERLPPPLGMPDLEPSFRAAFGDYSADGGPGMHGSSPCMTKLKAQRLFLGGHIFCHARFGAVNPRFGPGHPASIRYARQLARGADVRPTFIFKVAEIGPTL